MSAHLQNLSPAYTGPAARRIIFLRREAERMLNELECSRLEVILIPAPDRKHAGHSVRAVQEQNCKWYREFCSQYTARRKKPRRKKLHDTNIKRSWTRNGLLAIIRGRVETPYAQRLVDFIEEKGRRK